MAIVRLHGGRLRLGRILLLEEEYDDCELEAYELRHAGFQVVTAHTAIEALESARLLCPDVILCNLGADALVLAAACKELPALKDIPLIGITGHLSGLYSDELTALSGGFDALLRKPLSVVSFRAALARLFT